jgi:hypothetical protein
MPTVETQDAAAQFDRAYPWVVKSLRQSQLLEAWLRQCREGHGVPALANFSALRAYREQNELTVYHVVRDAGEVRFLVVKEGASFKALFGTSSKGRFLDEAMSPKAWQTARVTLNECVHQALPIYSAFAIQANDGERAIYERLLLPFGSGPEVTSIMASLKTTSWTGNDKSLTRPEGHDVEYSFRAVIALD